MSIPFSFTTDTNHLKMYTCGKYQTFISYTADFTSHKRRHTKLATGPLRHARTSTYTATPIRHAVAPSAVFLPPDALPPLPDDDDLRHDDADAPSPAAPTQYPETDGRDAEWGSSAADDDDDATTTTTTTTTGYIGSMRNSDMSFGRPSIAAEKLNDSLQPDHLQRHRHVLAPDEAFGAIFTLDVLVRNARDLELQSWQRVAEEEGFAPPDLDDIIRAESMAPEAAITRVFYWTSDWGDIKRAVFRKQQIRAQSEPSFTWRVRDGLSDFLQALGRYGVTCTLCSTLPVDAVMGILRATELDKFFGKGHVVSGDDDCTSMEQMVLLASVRAERAPQSCVLFTDRPHEITAGHEVTCKAVGVLGAHAAYDMKTADHVIADYDDIVVYDVRRLFSEEGSMTPQLQLEVEVDNN